MRKLFKDEKGFTLVEGLLITLVVAVIGFGGYYVWHTQHNKKTDSIATTTTNRESVSANNPYNDWKTFDSSYESVSFRYPKTWSLVSSGSKADGSYHATLTSPNGYKLNYYDTAESPSGSSCGSKEVILTSVQKVNIVDGPISTIYAPNPQTYIVESGNEIALDTVNSSYAPTVGSTQGCLFEPLLYSEKYPSTAMGPGQAIGFTSNLFFTPGTPKTVPSNQLGDFSTAKLILSSFEYTE